MALVFNSGRLANQQQRTVNAAHRRRLRGRRGSACATRARRSPVGKQRCRDRFIDEGYTLIANVGNNPTDFVGDGYERAYRLPNYGGGSASARAIRARMIPSSRSMSSASPILGAKLAHHVDEHLAGLDDPRVHVAEHLERDHAVEHVQPCM